MTKSNVHFVPISEAAKRLNKSDRTLRRYLNKLDGIDKKRLSKLSNKKLLVHRDFIKMVKEGFFKNSASSLKSHAGISQIEKLEARNERLFNIIAEKDAQLQAKDELIKQNLEDFKTLTSKVLFLQEQNLELQKPKGMQEQSAPMDERALQSDSKEKAPDLPTKTEGLLLFVFVALVVLLCLILFFLIS